MTEVVYWNAQCQRMCVCDGPCSSHSCVHVCVCVPVHVCRGVISFIYLIQVALNEESNELKGTASYYMECTVDSQLVIFYRVLLFLLLQVLLWWCNHAIVILHEKHFEWNWLCASDRDGRSVREYNRINEAPGFAPLVLIQDSFFFSYNLYLSYLQLESICHCHACAPINAISIYIRPCSKEEQKVKIIFLCSN